MKPYLLVLRVLRLVFRLLRSRLDLGVRKASSVDLFNSTGELGRGVEIIFAS